MYAFILQPYTCTKPNNVVICPLPAVYVEFFGVASVYWKEVEDDPDDGIDIKTSKNCNKETYFKHLITLARKGKITPEGIND